MRQLKRVRVFCHGVLAASATHETCWEDLHFSWKERPGRPRRMSGFCLQAESEVVADIAFNEQLQAKHPELDFVSDNVDDRRMLKELASGHPCAVDDWGCSFPSVAMRGRIDREAAERAITFALVERYGLRAPFKFDWHRPKFFAWPVSNSALHGASETP